MRVTPSILVIVALLLPACARGSSAQPSLRGFVQGDGSQVVPVSEREAAPDIEGETLDGDWLRLGDLSGPVVVNFWASWCGPCIQEQPHLVALANLYGDDVRFVGVDVKDGRASAQAFVRQFDMPYPSWFDPSASIAAQFGGIGPSALPTTMVLDADHRVAVRLFGAVDRIRLSTAIEAVLAPNSSEAPQTPETP